MFNKKPFEIILKGLEVCNGGEVPIASFIEVDGVYFPVFTNRVYEDKTHLNHAEILAINNALKSLNIIDFKNLNATLYSSLEPCCMCLAFACLVRVKKIIFFAEDLKFGGTSRLFTLNSAFTKQ
jgi:tRNA(adenine34) deaminase